MIEFWRIAGSGFIERGSQQQNEQRRNKENATGFRKHIVHLFGRKIEQF